MEIDVVIPHRDRGELLAAVSSCRACKCVERILVVDGGSTSAYVNEMLYQVEQNLAVEVLRRPISKFSRGLLLNVGLAAASARVVLVSDADILWTEECLLSLAAEAARGSFAHVAEVEERNALFVSDVAHERYVAVVTREAGVPKLTIEVASCEAYEPVRPGSGLICATAERWRELGGYVDDLVGWGWEDQDLLIRAQLRNCGVVSVGRALHITHDDGSRALGTMTKEDSRDANIVASLVRLARGEWCGSLATDPIGGTEVLEVSIPPKLMAKFEKAGVAASLFSSGRLLLSGNKE